MKHNYNWAALSCLGLFFVGLFMGFVLGTSLTYDGLAKVADAVHVEHFTVSFNETKMADAVYAKLQSEGLINKSRGGAK